MEEKESKKTERPLRHAVECASTIPVGPAKKCLKRIFKKTKGMNCLEFLRHLNKM